MAKIIKSFSIDSEISEILKEEGIKERGQSEFFRDMIKRGYALKKSGIDPEIPPVKVKIIG